MLLTLNKLITGDTVLSLILNILTYLPKFDTVIYSGNKYGCIKLLSILLILLSNCDKLNNFSGTI